VEIYPRALTGPLRKSSWTERHAYLRTRFPDQPTDLLERAAGSEDAFDAALSSLVMGAHDQFHALTPGLRLRLRNRRKDLAARVEAIESPLASALREKRKRICTERASPMTFLKGEALS
jgi:hypothetical protein